MKIPFSDRHQNIYVYLRQQIGNHTNMAADKNPASIMYMKVFWLLCILNGTHDIQNEEEKTKWKIQAEKYSNYLWVFLKLFVFVHVW